MSKLPGPELVRNGRKLQAPQRSAPPRGAPPGPLLQGLVRRVLACVPPGVFLGVTAGTAFPKAWLTPLSPGVQPHWDPSRLPAAPTLLPPVCFSNSTAFLACDWFSWISGLRA